MLGGGVCPPEKLNGPDRASIAVCRRFVARVVAGRTAFSPPKSFPWRSSDQADLSTAAIWLVRQLAPPFARVTAIGARRSRASANRRQPYHVNLHNVGPNSLPHQRRPLSEARAELSRATRTQNAQATPTTASSCTLHAGTRDSRDAQIDRTLSACIFPTALHASVADDANALLLRLCTCPK